MKMKMKPKQRLCLKIEGMGSKGEGVGRVDGIPFFIEGVLVDEEVVAEVSVVKKKFGRAVLIELLEASSYRVEPSCPIFGRCGGCQLMHLEYEQQLLVKRQRVVDALRRIGHFEDVEVAVCRASPQAMGYRNKIQMKVTGRGVLGMCGRASHDIVEVSGCGIHCSLGEEVLEEFRRSLRRHFVDSDGGVLRQVMVKSAEGTGEVLLVLNCCCKPPVWLKDLANDLVATVPAVQGVVCCVGRGEEEVLAGKASITEILSGLCFKVSAGAFFQVNLRQAEQLYRQAVSFAGVADDDVVLDGYCGVGTLSLLLAKEAARVVGVECIPEAIADARVNAEVNGVKNCEFICGDVAELLGKVGDIDIALLNPPRGGCGDALIEELVGRAVRRIVYVSCDPATLARDLARFSAGGYSIEGVVPFDMFPQTAHVETVVRLGRKRGL